MTHLYPFECYSPLGHPKEIEDDKMDGGEAEERDEGEGREHLLGSEDAAGRHVRREHQPHDDCDRHDHETKVAGSDECSLEDDGRFTPAGKKVQETMSKGEHETQTRWIAVGARMLVL